MDEINKNPSELHSSHVCKELNTNIMDLNKKRKLQAELLDLPLPKHICCGRSFSSQIVYPLDEDTEIEDLHAQIVKEETNGETIDDGSEPDSAKDSNSLAGYSDSVISVYGEAKFEPECEKTCPYNYPYSSSVNWGGNSSRDDLYSLKSTRMTPDVSKDKMTFFSGEHDPLVSQNLEEQLLEFGNDIDFMCSEYRDGMVEHSMDKELADMPYSSGMKPNNYVLSSGRWSVNQGNLHMTWNTFAQREEDKKNAMPLVTCKCKMLKLGPGSQPLIKNLSSIFPCLCCNRNLLNLNS